MSASSFLPAAPVVGSHAYLPRAAARVSQSVNSLFGGSKMADTGGWVDRGWPNNKDDYELKEVIGKKGPLLMTLVVKRNDYGDDLK